MAEWNEGLEPRDEVREVMEAKRHRMHAKTRASYMLSIREPPQTLGHPQTEGTEKGIPCKWNQMKARVATLISDKNRPQNKDYHKRQGRTLHNDQGINP